MQLKHNIKSFVLLMVSIIMVYQYASAIEFDFSFAAERKVYFPVEICDAYDISALWGWGISFDSSHDSGINFTFGLDLYPSAIKYKDNYLNVFGSLYGRIGYIFKLDDSISLLFNPTLGYYAEAIDETLHNPDIKRHAGISHGISAQISFHLWLFKYVWLFVETEYRWPLSDWEEGFHRPEGCAIGFGFKFLKK